MLITMPGTPRDAMRDPAFGERRLMAAVLSDALAVLSAEARRPCDRRLQAETWNWFMACDRDWPFSYDNVCESLGLNPEALRRRIARPTSAPPLCSWRSERAQCERGARLRLVG